MGLPIEKVFDMRPKFHYFLPLFSCKAFAFSQTDGFYHSFFDFVKGQKKPTSVGKRT